MIHPPPMDLPAITLRLCWALLLGTGIGVERQYHQKMAGLKTNALVALGAAGFVTFATAAGQGNPSVVSAQIVTGIGFLGAGVIMREGVNVHGLNTAATVWCSAMIGTLAGFGLWREGGAAASLVLGANLALRPLANRLNQRVQAGNEIESRYDISVTCATPDAPRVRRELLAALRQTGLSPAALQARLAAGGETDITAHAVAPHVMDDALEAMLTGFAAAHGVTRSSWGVTRAAPEA